MIFVHELAKAWPPKFNPGPLAKFLAKAPRIFFVGNGGSAAIASHMAADFSKNGGVPAMAFNDGASLTCLSNDFGYEHVFSKPILQHMRSGDCLVAISSSGKSPSILRAVAAARECEGSVVALSGFAFGNPLNGQGDWNYHVPSNDYGVVETIHLGMLHAVLREMPHARA